LTFAPAKSYPAGMSVQGVAAGDLACRGVIDFATANSGGNDVSVLAGNGDATFQLAVHYGAGAGPQSMALGDLNRDGKLDLIASDNGSSQVSVLLNKGNGNFNVQSAFVSSGSWGLAIGDRS